MSPKVPSFLKLGFLLSEMGTLKKCGKSCFKKTT